MAFLDFGRVKRLSPAFLGQWAALVRAIFERDRCGLQSALIDMGHVGIMRHFDFDFSQRIMASLNEPSLREGPYSFQPEYVQRLWGMLIANPNKSRVNYPSEHVFLHQLLSGSVSLLVRLRARVDMRSKILPLAYPDGRTPPPAFTEGELRLLGIPTDRWSRGPLTT